jgi:hypothetical protein
VTTCEEAWFEEEFRRKGMTPQEAAELHWLEEELLRRLEADFVQSKRMPLSREPTMVKAGVFWASELTSGVELATPAERWVPETSPS